MVRLSPGTRISTAPSPGSAPPAVATSPRSSGPLIFSRSRMNRPAAADRETAASRFQPRLPPQVSLGHGHANRARTPDRQNPNVPRFLTVACAFVLLSYRACDLRGARWLLLPGQSVQAPRGATPPGAGSSAATLSADQYGAVAVRVAVGVTVAP